MASGVGPNPNHQKTRLLVLSSIRWTPEGILCASPNLPTVYVPPCFETIRSFAEKAQREAPANGRCLHSWLVSRVAVVGNWARSWFKFSFVPSSVRDHLSHRARKGVVHVFRPAFPS